MALKKNLFEVKIAGIPFKLKTAHNEMFVNELVNFVNEHINKSLKETKSGSVQTAAVLTALNIAEEHLILKKQALMSLERLEQKASKISSNITYS